MEDIQLIAVNFWDEVAAPVPEWRSVRDEKMAAGEVRRDFIHSHGIVLHALGRVGCACYGTTRPMEVHVKGTPKVSIGGAQIRSYGKAGP